MSKDVKYIIAYSIGIGFFLTMLGLYGLAMLVAPGFVIVFSQANPWITGLCGLGGIGIGIYGIHKHTKNHRASKGE